MELRIAGITKESFVDGPGIRYVIFTQGCKHECEGCHNPDTHKMDGGYSTDVDELIQDIINSKHIDGVTISGGEPFLQAKECLYIIESLKKHGIHIICYTGYTFEQLTAAKNIVFDNILKNIDMLIDGKYVEGLRDLSLAYRGSKNQRIIDVKASISDKKIVLYPL